jgi:hypothetical protein
MSEILVKGTSADVMLLLEGTFPYVSGGVELGQSDDPRVSRYPLRHRLHRQPPQDYGEMAYALPDNVVHLETHFLYDFRRRRWCMARRATRVPSTARTLHEMLRQPGRKPRPAS